MVPVADVGCQKHPIQGARIWLPNIEGFFFLWAGYWKVQKGKGTMRAQRNHDSAEFFSRRLRENERTLATLTLRIDEAPGTNTFKMAEIEAEV